MPKRARGDRAAIEAALTPTLAAALQELRELLDVWHWQATPLAPPFQAAACVIRAAELVRQGRAPGDALHAAASELGLERETVRSWARRWAAASREGATCTRALRPSVAGLVRDAAEHTPTAGDHAHDNR
jgi:hypothetical protein